MIGPSSPLASSTLSLGSAPRSAPGRVILLSNLAPDSDAQVPRKSPKCALLPNVVRMALHGLFVFIPADHVFPMCLSILDLPVSAVLTKNAGVKMSTVEQKISFARKGVVNATKFLNVSTDALRAESAKELPNLAALKKLSAEAQDARFDLDDKKFEVLKLEGDLLAARYERLVSSSMDNCHKQMPVKNVAPQSAVTATNCIRPTNCGKQLIDGKKDFNGLDWHTKKDQRTGASATFDLGTEHAYTISVINVFNQNAGNGWDGPGGTGMG